MHPKNKDKNRNRRYTRYPARIFVIFCTLFFAVVTSTSCLSSVSKQKNESLDVKIGQMILIGFRGLSVDEQSPIIQDIRRWHIGGVILFDYDVPLKRPVRNIASPKQLQTLTASLQKASSIPLFIAIDQEGGKVNRLKEKFGFPPSVSEQYLGSLNNVEVTKHYAVQTARTLSSNGINLNFAPVVDLNMNPDNPVIGNLERSFSDNPMVVTDQAITMIDTFHEYGILSAIKHFPGHGSSTADSHQGFVDVTNTWSAIELKPFNTLIKAGKCDMVMTAHVFNETLDPKWPATLSYNVLTEILRHGLHYDGVIISDDMQMKAISSFYGLETAIKMAILAGIDILVFPNNSVFQEDIAARTITIIKNCVSQGIISENRINESYRRITKLKEHVKIHAE
ncbi:MAG: glycoside hydrolase family 3 protein [Deltaproteobacteria bacterium]|nr:glycoside hydrolase family 3 protein [Deltaproteobacteria bacterium]